MSQGIVSRKGFERRCAWRSAEARPATGPATPLSSITAGTGKSPNWPSLRTETATSSDQTLAASRARVSRVLPAKVRNGLPPPMRRDSPPASMTTASESRSAAVPASISRR